MNQTDIGPTVDMRLVTAKPSDVALLSPLAARRVLFEILTINAFERSVVDLKRSDCVCGPIHISIGQEAIAAASASALKRSDLITGSHRAHHIALAKILEYVLPDGWDPAEADVPTEAEEAVFKTLAEIMGLAPGWCGGPGRESGSVSRGV